MFQTSTYMSVCMRICMRVCSGACLHRCMYLSRTHNTHIHAHTTHTYTLKYVDNTFCFVYFCFVLLCMCACMYPCVFSIVSWRAVRVSIGIRHQIVNSSPRPKPIRQTRHGLTPFGGWGCALYGASVSPRIRASPSTCRVLTIDWQVRGLCRCLWHARGPCLCLCVTSPRGFTSLPTQEAEYSLSGFIPTNKQTNKHHSNKSK